MSDITGPPSPKPVQSVSHGTDRATGVSRDKQQTPEQQPRDHHDRESRSEQKETLNARDPAVSISASAAHLQVDEELHQKVQSVDAEGRPIIVTETATFALRPDAGLKAGDDVVLHVKEVEKSVHADLLRQNATLIDPPIRLSLVVISIHGKPEDFPDTGVKKTTDFSAPYRPQQSVSQTFTEAETLAKLMGRNYTPPPVTSASIQTGNPDPTVPSSSADLATLISAQQNASTKPQAANPAATPNPANMANTSKLLPESDLTRLAPAPTAAAAKTQAAQLAVGLGAAFTAATPEGKLVTLQLIDPSISRVPPAEVANVLSSSQLPADAVRSLSVNIAALGGHAGLVQLTTDKGIFVTAQEHANNLNGELVRVSSSTAPETSQAQQTTAPSQITPAATSANTSPTSDTPLFKAKLYGASGNPPREVAVRFQEEQPANASAQKTAVTAVHIVRGFLTAEGPKNDLRLDTPLGTLALTLDTSLRPSSGDPIHILPPGTLNHQTTTQPLTPQIVEVTPQSTATMAGITSGLGGWPAMTEAYNILAADNPALAATTAARSAEGGAKLLNSMMFLFSALKGGGKHDWMDPKAQASLSTKNAGLLDILKNSVSNLLSPAESASEWRSLLLPFDMRGSETSMLAFLFNHSPALDPDEDRSKHQNPDDEKEDTNQFVVEVEFTVLGPVQLNGLISGRKFDLSLYSRSVLSQSLQEDSSKLFNSALEANGFSGRLNFITSATFPVDVASILAKNHA